MSRPLRIGLCLELQWPLKRHLGVFIGIQKFAMEAGWETIIDEFAADNLMPPGSKTPIYDGVIARANRKLLDRSKRLNVPVVNVWLTSPVWQSLPGVFPDFELSGRMRAEHLLARGLRNFAVIVREDRGSKLEASAFEARLAEAGASCLSLKISLETARNLQVQRRYESQLNEFVNRWKFPIGVSASNDITGRHLVQLAHNRGLRVPDEVAVVAGMNEEIICENPRPSLTSVEMGHERVGYEAARMLSELIAKQRQSRSDASRENSLHRFLPPVGVVVRESTDFLASDEPSVAKALAFIASNCHRRIGASAVSKAVAIEPRTLQRRFQKALGRPIATTIRQARLERAKRELTQTDLSLSKIAKLVGFSNSMRMYDVFRRELGMSPSVYRQQRQIDSGKKS